MQDQTRRTFSPSFILSSLICSLCSQFLISASYLSRPVRSTHAHIHPSLSPSLRLCIINETGFPQATRNSCCTKTLPSSSEGTKALRKQVEVLLPHPPTKQRIKENKRAIEHWQCSASGHTACACVREPTHGASPLVNSGSSAPSGAAFHLLSKTNFSPLPFFSPSEPHQEKLRNCWTARKSCK